MAFIRNLTIKARLRLIIALVVLGLSVVVGYALNITFNAISQTKESVVRVQVESTYTLLEHFYGLYQSGALSEAEAQRLAKASLGHIRYNQDDYFWINDDDLMMVVHPMPSVQGTSLIDFKDANGSYLFRVVLETSHADKQGGFVRYPWPKAGVAEPVNKISYVKYFEPWQWTLGTGMFTDDVAGVFFEYSAQMITLSLVLLGLITLFIVLISNSIRGPLSVLTEAMFNISQGEGDLTQRLPDNGKDELAEISASFNQFVHQIHDVVEETQNSVAEVSRSSAEVSETCYSTSKLSNQQLHETDMAATASNEMSLTIHEVAGNAERAASAAKDVEDNAKHGLEVMQTTQRRIMELASDLQNSSRIIQGLREETETIGSVLDVIRGIAEQTNLLALNAAIEAARAGEQGRGFAVVADEVRTLASRSHQSTEEIDRMISRLQEQAVQAVKNMESNAQSSETTAATADQAMAAIASISEAVSTISEMNLNIASAMEEQSATANEISGNISKVADSSRQISDYMETTTQASGNLQQQASSVVHLVERFKV